MRKTLIILLCYFLFGCSVAVDGDGIIRSRSYAIKGIKELTLSGKFDVSIERGKREGVLVTTDNNIFSYISVAAKQGILTIRPNARTSINSVHGIKVKIVSRTLQVVKSVGESEVAIKELQGRRFEYYASGKSKALIGGTIGELVLYAVKGAFIDARYLSVKKAKATAQDNGKIYLKPSEWLYASSARGGHIEYFSKPERFQQRKGKGGIILQNLDPSMKPRKIKST